MFDNLPRTYSLRGQAREQLQAMFENTDVVDTDGISEEVQSMLDSGPSALDEMMHGDSASLSMDDFEDDDEIMPEPVQEDGIFSRIEETDGDELGDEVVPEDITFEDEDDNGGGDPLGTLE